MVIKITTIKNQLTFKTFGKKQNSTEFDLITHWFVYHRIRRFSSSRGIVPLYIFRKINYQKQFQSMYYCTMLRNSGRLIYFDELKQVYFSQDIIKNLDCPSVSVV